MRRCSSFSETEGKFVKSGEEEATKMIGLGTGLRSQEVCRRKKKRSTGWNDCRVSLSLQIVMVNECG